MNVSQRETGFTYLGVLFLVALMGTGLAATGLLWSTSMQRERERELLFIGREFQRAISAYYESTPGTVKKYPNQLSDLLRDDRRLTMTRHLRRIYLDPMTGAADWGVVRAPEGGIMGVHSTSEKRPLKTAGFSARQVGFENAKSYADWYFVYTPVSSK